jgi:hypothetical protein
VPLRLARSLPLLVVAAGCAAPRSDEDFEQAVAELQEWQRPQECGFRGAMGFGGRQPANLGDPVRACALPTAEEVARACGVHEATPNPDRRDPENPDDVLFDLPDYRVTALDCAFGNADNSSATCAFDLATATALSQRVEATLTYRFYARSTLLTFGYGTHWITGASCLPRAEADRTG